MNKKLRALFKKFKKRSSKRLLPFLIYCFMRGLFSTLRIRTIGEEIPEFYYRKKQGIIFAFWHGMMFPASFLYRGNGAHVLSSWHDDGALIGRVVRRFGFSIVRGSSSRGGREAMLNLEALLLRNRDVVVTPDGPRGPAEELKPGIAQLASRTGAPIISMAFSGNRLKLLKTWDKFRIPMPFSKIVIVCGDPVFYQEGEDLETFRKRIEDSIRALTVQADNCCRK